MRWLILSLTLACYEHHLLDDARAPDAGTDARVERDVGFGDGGADVPRDVLPDVRPRCEREWFDEIVSRTESRGELLVQMSRGGDVDLLFQSADGLQHARRIAGAWSFERLEGSPRAYAFDDTSQVFGYVEDPRHALAEIDSTGITELVVDPRLGGLDALWSSPTELGTILTWRQNLVQLAWCQNGPTGWTCEEEPFIDQLHHAHAISDPLGRRIHVGRFDRSDALQVRWGASRWTVDMPGDAAQTTAQAAVRDDRLDVIAASDACGIHHISLSHITAEPVVRTIDICPIFSYRFAMARGPSLHVFTRDERAAYHLEPVDDEWVRTELPMALALDPRRAFPSTASASADGWLGWAYLVLDGRDYSVHLLSSPPCDS